jgi:hypothetical protein
MPLEDDECVTPPLDLPGPANDRVDDDPVHTSFRLSSPVSWPTVLLSGELSALWTTLVLPWTTALKLHIELQEEPNFGYPMGFFDGSCTLDPSICLQVSRFLIWSHEDGCFSFCFCSFRLRLDGCFSWVSFCSCEKVSAAINSKLEDRREE